MAIASHDVVDNCFITGKLSCRNRMIVYPYDIIRSHRIDFFPACRYAIDTQCHVLPIRSRDRAGSLTDAEFRYHHVSQKAQPRIRSFPLFLYREIHRFAIPMYDPASLYDHLLQGDGIFLQYEIPPDFHLLSSEDSFLRLETLIAHTYHDTVRTVLASPRLTALTVA